MGRGDGGRQGPHDRLRRERRDRSATRRPGARRSDCDRLGQSGGGAAAGHGPGRLCDAGGGSRVGPGLRWCGSPGRCGRCGAAGTAHTQRVDCPGDPSRADIGAGRYRGSAECGRYSPRWRDRRRRRRREAEAAGRRTRSGGEDVGGSPRARATRVSREHRAGAYRTESGRHLDGGARG